MCDQWYRRRLRGGGVAPRVGALELAGDADQHVLAAVAATSWMPIGSPSSFQHNGTLIAGCPLMLNGGVNGTNRPLAADRATDRRVGLELADPQRRLAERRCQQQVPALGPPLLDRAPELDGGRQAVGVVDTGEIARACSACAQLTGSTSLSSSGRPSIEP